ncbi:MAG: flagellar basal body P-ring protein FlgI [Phycisphaerales bacterium]
MPTPNRPTPRKEDTVIVSTHRRPGVALISALCILGIALGACKGQPRTARRVDPPVVRDVPAVLRGTVGSMATIERARPSLVSGYGLVVGLNGTGGGDLDPGLSVTMERMLGLNGISKNNDALRGTPLQGMGPREVLRSRDIAVVVVYAAIIPGSPAGAPFDVYVSAVNRSPDLSLEGGTLWTTDLQMGPPTEFGQMRTRGIAQARGPVFINPFAEPGARDGYSRADGRVLSGGVVTNPVPMQLVLDNESHSGARSLAEAINERFPEQPGEGPTARGRTARIIDLTVPAAYRERTAEFMGLLTHIQTDTRAPQEYARRYVEALRSQPELAEDLTWCLRSLPQKAALPFLRPLYDDAEITPRMAALRAGASLGDPLAGPSLKQMVKDGPPSLRAEAIELLGGLSAGPTVDMALREQLSSETLSIRVAAYEALADRAELANIQRLLASRDQGAAVDQGRLLAARSQLNIAGDVPQGVRRRVVAGKFILDLVPGGKPLVYVTQQGRPRIVLFGDALEVMRPVTVSAWPGVPEPGKPGAAPAAPTVPTLSRLILVAESASDQPRIMYRTPDRTTLEGRTEPGRLLTSKVSERVPELIEFMAHAPSPEDPRPGLGMSYSELVGALYAFQRGGAITAPFAVEDDVLRARLMQAANRVEVAERPETAAEAEKLRVYNPVANPEPREAPRPAENGSLVVPLDPPSTKKK